MKKNHLVIYQIAQFVKKKYFKESSLKRHIKIVHGGEKDFKCMICDKMFGYKESLKEHITTIHGMKKGRYQCTHCAKVFPRMNRLKKHEKIHTELKNSSISKPSKSL
jgi:uncharacterized Zn-finger protein